MEYLKTHGNSGQLKNGTPRKVAPRFPRSGDYKMDGFPLQSAGRPGVEKGGRTGEE